MAKAVVDVVPAIYGTAQGLSEVKAGRDCRNSANRTSASKPDWATRLEPTFSVADMLSSNNAPGLIAEDIDPENSGLLGNSPQTYSMVGIINLVVRLGKR